MEEQLPLTDKWELRKLPQGGLDKSPIQAKTRLDEEIIEDADSRHEQFTEEADRWRDDDKL